MKSIDEIQDEIIEEFSVFDDWMDKYALLIDLGNALPPLDEKYKTSKNLIEGCQSRVWLQADYREGVSFGDYHGGNRLRGCVFAYQYIGYSGYDGRCVGGASCFL